MERRHLSAYGYPAAHVAKRGVVRLARSMTWRHEPPFRADHVGSLSAPAASSCTHGPSTRPGASKRTSCARSRTRRSATRCACRRRSGWRRRPTASCAAPRGTWTSSTSSAASRSWRPTSRSSSRTPAAASCSRRRRCASTSRCGSTTRSSATTSRSCATRVDDGHAEADDPVAEHGALPRRPRGHRRDDLSRPRRVLGRSDGRLPRGGEPARRARLQLPAARRHEPRVPQRPEAARAHGGDRRRPGAPARGLHPPPQRGHREPARRA